MNKTDKNVYVISGTHWDREWRYTAEQSLLRLAQLVDDLLDILETNPEYKCFHLDGGAIILEDYLAVRPENEERLRKLIQQGRIQTVLWYTLPEMSIVSPESLIRNILIGKRLIDQFGPAMKTGYTATSYGQISQLPQIYSGFGMDTALSYRGTNKHQVPPIGWWQSPDGTKIYHIRCFDEVTRTNWFFFVHYELVLGRLPRDLRTEWNADDWPVHMADEHTYQTAFQMKNEKLDFSTDEEKMQAALRHFVEQASPQAIGHNLLALDMEDNASPYNNLPDLIKSLNEVQDEYHIKQTSLDEYVGDIKEAVKNEKLPVHEGEMRYAAIEDGFNGLLGTTQSSRVLLKLMNEQAEGELIGVAEPLCSFCSIIGGSYPHTLLDRAWHELLKNHAHDSICGAAINEAHKDNPSRFRAATAIARECSRLASEELWTMLDTQKGFQEGDLTITFFNTLSTARKGVQPVIMDVPNIVVGDALLEPCSGTGPIREGIDPDKMVTYDYFDIVDEDGVVIPHVLLEKEKADLEVERKLDSNAAAYLVFRNRLLLDVDIPAFGYKTYAFRPRVRKYVTHPKPGEDRVLLAQLDGILENEFVKIKINPNGTFDYTDKQTGRTVGGMHYFNDEGSIGNAHTRLEPLRNYSITTLGNSAAISLMENNALRATWQIDQVMHVPADIDVDGKNRSGHLAPLPITTYLTLRKGAKQLEIKTRVDNSARDHRLRVMFPTDISTDYVDVDGPFDVLKRDIQWNETAENREGHFPCKPMGDFVGLSDGLNGVSVFSKGLREYEAVDDKRRTVAITLLRCHRAYMLALRGTMTPQEYAAQDGQHSPGVTEFEYAVSLHKGNWAEGNIPALSRQFKMPQRIIQGVPKPGTLPACNSFLKIEPAEHVQFSALYHTEDAKGYILRIWNNHNEPVTATIESPLEFKSITKVSMDEETKQEALVKNKDSWKISLRKAEIATLLIEM
jgi:alpha-mannosidase